MSDASLERLWNEYGLVFREFDDLMLARWMAQTLGQLQGRAWRLSHPLLGAYRLAAQVGHQRQIWLKRLVRPPSGYPDAPCCRAPLLGLLTRDVLDSGLVCQHCGGTAITLDELPSELQLSVKAWAEEYHPVHAVAHWDEKQRAEVEDYEAALDNAAKEAERLLGHVGQQLSPRLLDIYPAIVWEDQDECLDVKPEDIEA